MPFFVKRNGQAVPIVSDPNVINDTTASQNTAFSGSKVDSLIANHTHASNQINAMTGYSKPSSTSSITPSDSLNTAIGKVEKGLEGKQSPLSLGQYSGLGREIQVMDNEEVGQTWYNTGVVDIEPSSSEGKLTVSKVDDSTFPGSAPYTSEDIDIPGWEKVENSPITTTATGTDLTLSTSEGNINALTVYGKSEVVDGSIKSAGEGYAVVDLGTLDYAYTSAQERFYATTLASLIKLPATDNIKANCLASIYQVVTLSELLQRPYPNMVIAVGSTGNLSIRNAAYTDPTAFKTAMSGVLLCYELADPTQGNTIAVKTDNGTGIDGTMAVFETGTPLYGVSDTVRDVMAWDGSAGTATKNCGKTAITGTHNLNKWESAANGFYASLGLPTKITPENIPMSAISNVAVKSRDELIISNDVAIGCNVAGSNFLLIIPNATTIEEAQAYLQNNPITLIYELATPTTTPLTTAENASIAGLRTFEPQTHAQNNAGAEMTVEAYAGTANGQAITEIADKLDTLTPKVYSLFIAKTDWDETGTVEIDVPGTFGYNIPSGNYNQLVLSSEQTNYWRKFNVCLDHAHDASGYITTIEFSCDPGNIPDRPIFFNIVSSKPKYVDWSVIDNLIVPPGLQVDTSLDEYSTNPVQNKVVKAALESTINDTAVTDTSTYSSKKIEDLIERHSDGHYVFSVVIDHNNNNPATCVKPHYDARYGCDNYNYTPAKMNYTTDKFDYGSWENWVLKHFKPCMKKYDGTVDYYLDPNDYTKKLDGSISDVANMSYDGNAMVEIDTIYKKAYTANGKDYIWLSDKKLDRSFKAYAHHDKKGKVLPHIYRACYDGSYDGTRLRSISGIDYHNLNTLTVNKIMSNTTRQQEIDFAKANNSTNEKGEGWYILHKSEWDLINDVLIVMSLSLNMQGTFGRGRDKGYSSETNTGVLSTGTMNTKGMFWGKNDGTTGVKVLGIENPWGNIQKSCAGWMLINNQHYTKMTIGTEDGSTGTGFNTDGTGYLATGSNISANGYISNWVENDNGFLPTAASGSASTYRCDYVWQNAATNFALIGGRSHRETQCGAFYSCLDNLATATSWGAGAVLTYKGLVEEEYEPKITQSNALTLTANGWSSNTQTVSYAHDTSKRNVIDVEPSSIEEWASCGVLAMTETSADITFTCKTAPTNALTFRVTSMGV